MSDTLRRVVVPLLAGAEQGIISRIFKGKNDIVVHYRKIGLISQALGSGKPAEALPPVADRKALEIDVDNFDERLKSMKPRSAFKVPNTLTGEGNLSVDISFESMDDFSPAAVASKVDSLNKMLGARTQLANLLTYMDGKSGAEELIKQALADPTLLQSLASAPKPEDESQESSEE